MSDDLQARSAALAAESHALLSSRTEPPPLKSIADHNAERLALRRERERLALLTGVACPQCGTELQWRQSATVLAIIPPPTDWPAMCPQCHHTANLET